MDPLSPLDQIAYVAKRRNSGRVKKPPIGLTVGAIVKIPMLPLLPNVSFVTKLVPPGPPD